MILLSTTTLLWNCGVKFKAKLKHNSKVRIISSDYCSICLATAGATDIYINRSKTCNLAEIQTVPSPWELVISSCELEIIENNVWKIKKSQLSLQNVFFLKLNCCSNRIRCGKIVNNVSMQVNEIFDYFYAFVQKNPKPKI